MWKPKPNPAGSIDFILFLKIFIIFYLVHRKLISTLEKGCVVVVVVILWYGQVSWWSAWFTRSLNRRFVLGRWPRTGIGLPCGLPHLGFLINNPSLGRQVLQSSLYNWGNQSRVKRNGLPSSAEVARTPSDPALSFTARADWLSLVLSLPEPSRGGLWGSMCAKVLLWDGQQQNPRHRGKVSCQKSLVGFLLDI